MTQKPRGDFVFDSLLLVAHGTRDENGLAEARSLAEMIAARVLAATRQEAPTSGYPASRSPAVQLAFLELAEPDLFAGADSLVRAGCRRIVVSPLLLFAAGHAKCDLPEFVAAAAARWPQVAFALAPVLDCHPKLLELSEVRFQEVQFVADAQPADTVLLLVGRGSTDPEANAEMARFARLRWERWPAGWVEVAFAALAEPSLGRALEVVAFLPQSTIAVQPHLLFRGELLAQIHESVHIASENSPGHRWLIAPHLGVDPLLVEAVVHLARAAKA